MWTTVLIVIAVLVAGVLVTAALRPGDFAAPRGDATEVQWTMRGPTTYLMKLMGMFSDMDKMIGKDFEQGLANLKAAAEK